MTEIVSVEAKDTVYKEVMVCYAVIDEVKVRNKQDNKLIIYEQKKKNMGGRSKGTSLGYLFKRDLFKNYLKRKNKEEKFLIVGQRSFAGGDYQIGGKILFSDDYTPSDLVVFIKTRGEKEIIEQKTQFPKEFFVVKGDTFDFEAAKKKVKDLLCYIEVDDALYNEKVVFAAIEDGKFSSPITKTFLKQKMIHVYEQDKYCFGTNRGRREIGRIFDILVDRSILWAKEKGESEVSLGEFNHEGYVVGSKFYFGDNYEKKDLEVYIKPRGVDNSMKVKRVPFPVKKLYSRVDINLEEEMKKVKDLLCYIQGRDALFFEKIIYATVEDGKISAARLGLGQHDDKLINLYSMNEFEIGKSKGLRFGQVFSLQLKNKIELAKKSNKNEVSIGHFSDTSKKSGNCFWGGKITLKDWKPDKIVLYFQGRGIKSDMNEVSIDFSEFPSVEKWD